MICRLIQLDIVAEYKCNKYSATSSDLITINVHTCLDATSDINTVQPSTKNHTEPNTTTTSLVSTAQNKQTKFQFYKV